MTIEHDSQLPPLHPKEPPVVPVQALLAVETVVLMAGDVPRGVLKEFYGKVLGMTFVPTEDGAVVFAFQRRQVRLERERQEAGRLGMILQGFGEAMLRLRDRQVPYELLHTDAGLTRMAMVRDPAGNWLHLVETRPF